MVNNAIMDAIVRPFGGLGGQSPAPFTRELGGGQGDDRMEGVGELYIFF